MQARAECLAWINCDDGVARCGDVLAPWGAHHDAADTQDRELRAPARRPLFGGDRSHQQRPNAAQANATIGEGGEPF